MTIEGLAFLGASFYIGNRNLSCEFGEISVGEYKERGRGAIPKLPGNCEASFWDGRDAIVSIIKGTPSGFALTEAGLNLVCHFLSK